MIGPELLAIERNRARGEWDRSEILHLRALRLWMKPCNTPFFPFVGLIFVLAAAQHIHRAIGKGVAANLGTDIDLAQNVSVVIELQDLFLIPLDRKSTRLNSSHPS